VQKIDLLSSAWALVNTSIHEALATSFLEALACETPLLACTDQENLVSRFGTFTGSWDGDGMDGIPRFESGLQQLLDNRNLRIRLGQQGREWVQRTHNGTNFLRAFNSLCVSAGLRRNQGDSVKAWPGN
jgi:glycosyltransferase involved in cell wall biosynthesis